MDTFETVHTSYHSNRADDTGIRGTILDEGVRPN